MKKKICFLTGSIFTLGGVQRAVTVVSNALYHEGYDVHIICVTNDNRRDNALYGLNEKIKVKFVSQNILEKILFFWAFILKKIIIKNENLYKKTKLISLCFFKVKIFQNREIINYINENKIDDVVGVASFYTMFLCVFKNKLSTKKLIGWQHSTCESYFEISLNNTYLKYLFKEKFDLLSNYIVLTDYDVRWIKQKFNYNATCIYNPRSFISEEKSDLKSKNFIAVGRFAKEKGFDRLIDAFNIFSKNNKDWNLMIIGEGSLKEQLENEIKKFGLEDRIKLLPRTNEIQKFYLQSSIYLLSSYIEGLGIVLVEACECGVPIISYDLPSTVEQFKTCSVLVKNNDIVGYAKAMLDLVNDKELLHNLSKKAIINADNYSIEKIVKSWQKIL